MSHCLAKFGRVDILHNNVGIVRNGGPVEQSEADWDRVMAVNVKSMFLTSKHVLPVMQRQGCGVITNISSLASLRFSGTPWISYSASKGAVNQFTQAVAMQYAKRGIRANAIVPGLINTPMTIEPHLGSYADLDDMLARRHARCPTGSGRRLGCRPCCGLSGVGQGALHHGRDPACRRWWQRRNATLPLRRLFRAFPTMDGAVNRSGFAGSSEFPRGRSFPVSPQSPMG